jgi:para-nitrobenzyl esterase
VLCALVTDRFFRNPTFAAVDARMAAGGPAATYLYEFAWRSPVLDIGAGHAIEIPFVFDNLTAADAQVAIGTAAPADLAAEMHAAWVRFAATGDPGWSAVDASYPVMIFGSPGGSAVVVDPRSDERASWPDTNAG